MEQKNTQLSDFNDFLNSDQSMFCQVCFGEENITAYLCHSCLASCCRNCYHKHICKDNLSKYNNIPKSFQKINIIQKDIFQASSTIIDKKTSGISERISKVVTGRCQRCIYAQAIKECYSCKLNKLCESCFREVHAFSSKMGSHQYSLIESHDKIQSKLQKNMFKVCKQDRKESSDLSYMLKFCRYVNEKQSQNVKISNQFQRKIEGELQEMTLKLALIQNQINYSLKNSSTSTQCLLFQIREQFEDMMEQIKLKLFEIEIKIDERRNLQGCERKKLQHQFRLSQREIQNISKILLRKDYKNIPNIQYLIENKLKQIELKISKVDRDNQKLQLNDLQKVSSYFYQQSFKVKEFIRKLDCKKIYSKEDPLKHSTITTKNQKNCPTDSFLLKSSTKVLKNSVTLASYKSIDKFNGYNYASPQNKVANNMERNKFSKKYESDIVKSNTESNTQRKKENSLKHSNLFEFRSLKNQKNPQTQMNLIQYYSNKYQNSNTDDSQLRTPKQFAKKLNHNSQNNAKNGLLASKQLKKNTVDRAKKMLKQIRSEMKQFTNQCNPKNKCNQRLEEDRSNLQISNLSINSQIKGEYTQN